MTKHAKWGNSRQRDATNKLFVKDGTSIEPLTNWGQEDDYTNGILKSCPICGRTNHDDDIHFMEGICQFCIHTIQEIEASNFYTDLSAPFNENPPMFWPNSLKCLADD